MNDEPRIRQLIDRFFEGETSLQEEQLLYDYFNGSVAPDLEELRPLFQGLDAMRGMDIPERKPQRIILPQWLRWVTSTAAAVVIAAGIGIWHNRVQQNLCEAYIHGQRTTDPERVMAEVRGNLRDIYTESGNDVDAQLRSIFGE